MPHFKSVGGNLVPMAKYLADEAAKSAKAEKAVSKKPAVKIVKVKKKAVKKTSIFKKLL